MALGAEKSDVLRLVVGQSALLTIAGVTLGLLAALPIPNLLGSAFNGMPVGGAFGMAAGVAVMVASVALLASYIPARRATRVEPVVALRYE